MPDYLLQERPEGLLEKLALSQPKPLQRSYVHREISKIYVSARFQLTSTIAKGSWKNSPREEVIAYFLTRPVSEGIFNILPPPPALAVLNNSGRAMEILTKYPRLSPAAASITKKNSNDTGNREFE